MAGTFNIILKNSSSKVASFSVSTLIWLALTPFIIHSLGDVDYGIWVLVGSICGFYGILDLGITTSIVRYVSKYVALDDMEGMNTTVNTCLAMYIILAVLIIVFSIVMAFTFPFFFNVPEGKAVLMRTVLILLGLNLALAFPFRVFSGVLQATMKYTIVSTIGIGTDVLRAVLIVFALKSQGGLLGLVFAILAVSMVGYLANLYFTFREVPSLKIGLRFLRKEKLREIFNYSIYTFVAMIGDLLRFNIDSIIIGAMLTVSAITPFSLAQKLIKFPLMLISQTFSVTTPMYSGYEAKGDTLAIQKLLMNSTFYSALISFFIASMFLIYGDIFITLWVGEEYSIVAYPILIIFAFSFCIALAQNPSIHAAYGIEKHKVLAGICLVDGLLNLILTLILVGKMGLIGVALGTAIPLALTKGIVQPIYICRVIKIPILLYLRKCFLIPFCTVFVFTLLHIAFDKYLQITSYYHFAIATVVSTSLFILFTIVVVTFNRDQKAHWKGILISLKQKALS